MRIHEVGRPQDVSKIASVEGAPKAAPVAKDAAKSESVLQVQVSDRAQELAARAERAAELKAQIKDGSFKVDADKIAAKLVGGDE